MNRVGPHNSPGGTEKLSGLCDDLLPSTFTQNCLVEVGVKPGEGIAGNAEMVAEHWSAVYHGLQCSILH